MPDLLPEEIPEGWKYSTVGSVSTNDGDYGSSASARDYHPDMPRYVRITDIQQDGTLDPESRTSITFEEADGHLLEEGDIVFARSGATVGKTYLYDPDDGVCAYAGYVIKYQIDSSKADPRYVHYWTKSPLYWRRVERTLRKGAQPNINASEYRGFELLLPPLPEQRRITDVLDTIDTAIQETDAVVEKQEQVKTGLLQDLLTRGLDADGRLRDPERAPEAFQESEVGKIPTDWSVKPLQSLVEAPIVYGILKPGKGVTGGVPVIKVKDIKKGHVQDDDLLLTDPEIHEKYKRAELREGDLLFTIRGTVGRMAFVPPHLDGANITQDTARIRVGDANPRYIRYYLGTSAPQAYFKMHTIGQAVTGINLGQLRQTPIAVPSREEQDRIVNVLDEQFSRIDEERSYREKLQSLKTGLMQDLLTGRVRVPEAEAHVDEVVA